MAASAGASNANSQLKTDAKRTIALCVPGLSPVLVDAMATSFASVVAQQTSMLAQQQAAKPNKLKVVIPPPKFALRAANSEELNLVSPQFGRLTRQRVDEKFQVGAPDMRFNMPPLPKATRGQ